MQALFSHQSNGLQSSLQSLIELLPVAAYGVRAPDGVIVWYNSLAAELWGRKPIIGDLDERFCGSFRLYMPDGSYMAHTATPMVAALEDGTSLHKQDVIIERPDGTRVTVCVHIDPIRDNDGKIVGVVNFFYDVSDRTKRETDAKAHTDLLEIAVAERTASLSELSRRLIKRWLFSDATCLQIGQQRFRLENLLRIL